MSVYDRLADLPVRVDAVDLERLDRETSAGWTRVTTEVVLSGDGVTGRGEDVTYEEDAHAAWVAAGPETLPIVGDHTVDSASDALAGVDLFPGYELDRDVYRHYRRWGIESAVLDLALKQAETDLGAAIDRSYDPVRFVVSPRLGDPPSAASVEEWLSIDPTLEFKLDAEPDWTPALAEELAATDRVCVVDLKGLYEGTTVDTPADPDLYQLVAETFPGAVIEDARVTDETEPILSAASDRLSWDAPIHSVADIGACPFDPRWLNIKPSRFGRIEDVLAAIEHCRAAGIQMYGGGQFELGVGRDHIQALASLFYPDGPNDVAPRRYNDPEPAPDLPRSPLEPASQRVGFSFRP